MRLIPTSFKSWSDDKVPRMAAALAYYTVFSIAPLLLIVISIASLVFGNESAKHQIVDQLQSLLGTETAKSINTMLSAEKGSSSNIVASIIGFITLLLGASGVFSQLKASFNEIWHVEPSKSIGVMGMIKDNFLSFSLVIGIGFLLLVSLVISTLISVIGAYLKYILPFPEIVLHIVNGIVSVGIISLLFAIMFKFLPNVHLKWSDVLIGSIFTAVLFTVGKFGIGLYVGHAATFSKYGPAGSLVILLVWVYYSAQIVFFGTEFTKNYTYLYGSKKKITEEISPSAQLVGSFLEGMAKGVKKAGTKVSHHS